MVTGCVRTLRLFMAVSLIALASATSVGAQVGTQLNNSSDPNDLYGRCLAGGSGMRSKIAGVFEAGETMANVLAITVLSCTPFSGGGGFLKTPCPSSSPYAYCLRNQNDGQGNDVSLGILKLDSNSAPSGKYCPASANPRNKVYLLRKANIDPRTVKGIITLQCAGATQPSFSPPTVVACPAGPNPYSYCLATPNDGLGNAVTVGVIRTSGATDPYGLYGECNTLLGAAGIKEGFLPKSSLVQAVGGSLDNVSSITITLCSDPTDVNYPPQIVPCSVPRVPFSDRFDYCIQGTDKKGNGVTVGVNKN